MKRCILALLLIIGFTSCENESPRQSYYIRMTVKKSAKSSAEEREITSHNLNDFISGIGHTSVINQPEKELLIFTSTQSVEKINNEVLRFQYNLNEDRDKLDLATWMYPTTAEMREAFNKPSWPINPYALGARDFGVAVSLTTSNGLYECYRWNEFLPDLRVNKDAPFSITEVSQEEELIVLKGTFNVVLYNISDSSDSLIVENAEFRIPLRYMHF